MLDRPVKDEVIKEGDLVIVYERHDRMKAVTVAKGAELQNRYGVFPHSDWLGRPFGCKVSGKSGSGFVYLLAPTPELWTCVLSHRTQILYIADISFVVSYLELRPGNIVLESGTGSGSLTTSLARAVAPSGHVHTFDFHEQRASSARQDFERNGLAELITVDVRDIQGQGFPDELSGKVDAVFLDLPQPWLAVPSVTKMLHQNGALCTFSPCIEQVQKTYEALQNQDFTDVRTFEILLRTYEVREEFLIGPILGQNVDVVGSSPPLKKPRQDAGQDGNSFGHPDTIHEDPRKKLHERQRNERGSRVVMAKPVSESRGHTGYLTFAVRST